MKTAGVSNDLRLFRNRKEAKDYLLSTQERPLIIICDINMPVKDGLQLRKEIQENDYLRNKSIPFIFYPRTQAPQP